MRFSQLTALSLAVALSGCASTKWQQAIERDRASLPHREWVTWTGSMYPLVQGGEQIDLSWVPFSQVKPGDLVRFWPAWSRSSIVHRAIGWEGPGRLITKGDNCERRDPWVVTEDIYLGIWAPVPGTTALPRPAYFPRSVIGLKTPMPK